VTVKAGTHYPYVRAVFLRPVRTGRVRTYVGPYGKKHCMQCFFARVQPVRTGGVYGTPVYVARNVIPVSI